MTWYDNFDYFFSFFQIIVCWSNLRDSLLPQCVEVKYSHSLQQSRRAIFSLNRHIFVRVWVGNFPHLQSRVDLDMPTTNEEHDKAKMWTNMDSEKGSRSTPFSRLKLVYSKLKRCTRSRLDGIPRRFGGYTSTTCNMPMPHASWYTLSIHDVFQTII